ncbi:hypothetical protein FKB34_01695 [Glycocaulis profundi]|nr:hypothetical protein FKB34_01695 [Glycocaulis profundi]
MRKFDDVGLGLDDATASIPTKMSAGEVGVVHLGGSPTVVLRVDNVPVDRENLGSGTAVLHPDEPRFVRDSEAWDLPLLNLGELEWRLHGSLREWDGTDAHGAVIITNAGWFLVTRLKQVGSVPAHVRYFSLPELKFTDKLPDGERFICREWKLWFAEGFRSAPIIAMKAGVLTIDLPLQDG